VPLSVKEETKPSVNESDWKARERELEEFVLEKTGVTPPPTTLPKTNYGLQLNLAGYLTYLEREPASYCNARFFFMNSYWSGRDDQEFDLEKNVDVVLKQYRDFCMSVTVAYGFLSRGNNMFRPEKKEERKALLSILVSDQKFKAFASWALPFFRESWKRIPEKHRKNYRALAEHSELYIEGFDEGAERRYLESLKRDYRGSNSGCLSEDWQKRYYKLDHPMSGIATGDLGCEGLFARFSMNGDSLGGKRKLEAFIFRRVVFDGVARGRLLGAIKLLRKEMN
jgi:hypothetical protein